MTGRSTGRLGALLGAGALIMGAVACGSNGPASGGGGTTGGTGVAFQKLAPNNSGTPAKGGTLNVLGTGDVDFLDPNITYYTVGYAADRVYSRQLYTYAAMLGHTTDVVPDLAQAAPTISNGGKTYTVTIKKGVTWDTGTPRQITAADEIRGNRDHLQPGRTVGRSARHRGAHRRHDQVL